MERSKERLHVIRNRNSLLTRNKDTHPYKDLGSQNSVITLLDKHLVLDT